MQQKPLEVFKASLPAIRSAWIDLLSDEPSLSALGRSGTVGFLMDASFIQVTVGLRASGTAIPWLERLLPVAGPVHHHLACGAVGIRKYYSTGQQAIRAVIGQVPEARVDEVISIFNNIAQREILALCAACKLQDCECCSVPATWPAPSG